MNQMILHSKCMAARDQQVGEKQAAKRAAAAEEKLVVQEMEERRKAGLQEQEVRGCRAWGASAKAVAWLSGRRCAPAWLLARPTVRRCTHMHAATVPPHAARIASGLAPWSRRRGPS